MTNRFRTKPTLVNLDQMWNKKSEEEVNKKEGKGEKYLKKLTWKRQTGYSCQRRRKTVGCLAVSPNPLWKPSSQAGEKKTHEQVELLTCNTFSLTPIFLTVLPSSLVLVKFLIQKIEIWWKSAWYQLEAGPKVYLVSICPTGRPPGWWNQLVGLQCP